MVNFSPAKEYSSCKVIDRITIAGSAPLFSPRSIFDAKEKIKKTQEKAPKIMRDHFIGCKNLLFFIY
jgi:hypothetical protein